MYEETIKILKELARTNQEKSKEIGVAIGLVSFCNQNGISIKDNVFEIPSATENFGYFTVQECSEIGSPINIVNDKSGAPLEVTPESLIIERKLS